MSRPKAPEGETPEARFIRLGSIRISRAIEVLDSLAKLGENVPSQEYVDDAFAAIQASVDKARMHWSNRVKTEKVRAFSFASGAPAQAPLPAVSQSPTPAPAANKAKAK